MSASSVAPAIPVGKGFQVYKPERIFRFGQWVVLHHWTEDEDVILRRDYRHSVASLRDLGVHFGVSENAIRQRLNRMGILRQGVKWSDKDIQYLTENYAKLSPRVIAKRLHKSVNTVVAKAHRLHITNRARDGWFTKNEIAEIFGVDQGWINRRINGRGLRLDIEPYDPERMPSKGSYASWRISERALREFIRRYPEELTGLNVDFVMLVDILAGVKSYTIVGDNGGGKG